MTAFRLQHTSIIFYNVFNFTSMGFLISKFLYFLISLRPSNSLLAILKNILDLK
jgi:hypothetical protein